MAEVWWCIFESDRKVVGGDCYTKYGCWFDVGWQGWEGDVADERIEGLFPLVDGSVLK